MGEGTGSTGWAEHLEANEKRVQDALQWTHTSQRPGIPMEGPVKRARQLVQQAVERASEPPDFAADFITIEMAVTLLRTRSDHVIANLGK